MYIREQFDKIFSAIRNKEYIISVLLEKHEANFVKLLHKAERSMSIAINQKDYKLAISIMLLFSPCIDAFFKTVLINAPQEDIRSNRRAIIRRIHKLFIACKVDFEGLNETSLKNLSITQSRIRKLYDSFQKEGQE